MKLPAAYVEFLELFGAGEFWESHELLERPWRDGGSGFYKGLILLASAHVHVGRGNPHGIDAQLHKAERELEPYRPAYLGLDVEMLLRHAADGRAAVRRFRGDPGADWTALVPPPRLLADPALVRGDEPELSA